MSNNSKKFNPQMENEQICLKNLDLIFNLERSYLNKELERQELQSIILNACKEFSDLDVDNYFDQNKLIELFINLEKLKMTINFEDLIKNAVLDELEDLNNQSNAIINEAMYFNNNKLEIGRNDEFNQVDTIFFNKQNKSFNEYSENDFKCDFKNLNRAKRSNYPKKISKILKNWLKENMNHPYPSEYEKANLIKYTGLDSTQINNWFINARRRILPFMKNKYMKYE